VNPLSLILFGLWLILNGRVTLEIAVIGMLATLAVMLFLWKFLSWPPKKEWAFLRQIPQLLLYLGRLAYEIALANIAVGKIILRREQKPVIRVVRTSLKTQFTRAMLANSITITPGTVTLELDGELLTVHCLTPELADGLENSALERRLRHIEEGLHGTIL